MAAQLPTSISTFLSSRGLSPSQAWLEAFLSTARPSTPLPALQQTALFRLLSSDITSSIQPSASNTLPPNIINATVKEATLSGPIIVQVLDIEDVGRSRWSQVESLEAQERGETTKGREIVRVVPGEVGENGNVPDAHAAEKSTGPHKLLLQDANGTNIYAFELARVDGIGLSMSIGAKLVLRRATIARGVILLDSATTELLGGKIDSWDKSWRAARKAVLKEKVGVED